jgi:hypothetical protein
MATLNKVLRKLAIAAASICLTSIGFLMVLSPLAPLPIVGGEPSIQQIVPGVGTGHFVPVFSSPKIDNPCTFDKSNWELSKYGPMPGIKKKQRYCDWEIKHPGGGGAGGNGYGVVI